jgi:aspartate/methionine/tyrosine aminotransferase
MHWAKVRPPARFNLASSGAPDLTLADLPPLDVGPGLTSPHAYGYPPLMDAIAARYGASAENVVTATGTSMANHLAIAALIGHGDDVLMEWPGYEPLVATARFLGASVRFFQRGPEQGFAVDAAELARLLTHKTRLIVLTNPHNPSGALIGEDELTRIGAVAAKVRAHVLVDEAYLDVVAGARSAFHSGPQFVATSSLAKSYGLSGLRCGWILCEQETAQRIWRLYDLFEASPVYLAERTSHALFPYLDRVLERTRGLIERNRRTLHALYDRSEDVAGIRTGEGSIAFPKVLRGDADRLCKLLIERYEVAVAPGRFFGLEYHFRIGLARDPEMFVQGIERLEAALNEVRRA